VNIARLPLGALLLGTTYLITSGRFWPAADATHIGWLALSAVIGLTLGDSLLFYAFQTIGPRRSMLMFAGAPVFTAVTAWIILGEKLGPAAIAGMVMILGGVTLAQSGGDGGGGPFQDEPKSIQRRGVIAAILGGVCQGVGATITKLGMETIQPLPAAFVRMVVGTITMWMFVAWRGQLTRESRRLLDGRAAKFILGAVVLGPFLGMWSSLAAFHYADAGVAMALIGTGPITVLLPAWIVYRDKPSGRGLAGALLAVSGGAVLFIQ
jgi:drug/metabolite transporter (DMT)-like permease